MKRGLLLLLVAALFACTRQTDIASEEDASVSPCADPCACCAAGEVCFEGACCAPACAGKSCGPDGCGGQCGTCQSGWACNPADGTCSCEETDEALCLRLEAKCGALTAENSCGEERTVDCGVCPQGQACNGASHACECEETDAEFCASHERECGALAADDSCGFARTVEDCGACDPLDRCTAGTCVLCVGETDAEICVLAGKECGPATWVDLCGATRQISDCGGCTDYKVCLEGTCGIPPPPANDYCSAAERLVFVAGTTTLSATTRWAADDSQFGCTVADGRDVFYEFSLPSRSSVTAKVTRLAGAETYVPVVIITRGCGTGSPYLSCGVAVGDIAIATTGVLPPGTYYLKVDGEGGTFGEFSLEVTLSPPPQNDDCASAQVLAVDPVSGATSVSGECTGALNDANLACNADAMGGDVVYTFSIPAGAVKNVRVDVVASAGSLLVPSVAIRSPCGQASGELGCVAAVGSGLTALSINLLGPGDYAIWVEGVANTEGSFTLDLHLSDPPSPPPSDLCATAPSLIFDSFGTANVWGNTADGHDDDSSYCSLATAPLNGPDLVFSFTLTAAAAVTATVTPGTAGPAYKPAVSIRSGCAPATEVACARDLYGVSTLSTSLPQGTYYVFVDGVGSTNPRSNFGPFTLTLTQGTVVPGDGCGSPTPLLIDALTGIAYANGNLTGASDSGIGSCVAYSGNDLVYVLVLANQKDVRIAASAAGGTWSNPVVYVRGTCADPTTELGCRSDYDPSAPATLILPRLQAGTYYVWVDGPEFGGGPIDLTVETVDPQPLPLNDTCAAPEPIVLDSHSHAAHVHGDTMWATNDFAGTCANAAYPHSGPDLAYSVVLDNPATLYAVVNKDPSEGKTFNPVVYLRSTCASAAPADELACGTSMGRDGTSITRTLPAGTYYLIVDGQRGYYGRFLLDVVARSSATTTNDTCATSESIVLDANGRATVAGSTAGLVDDLHGSCNSTTTAPDVVYRLTTSAVKDIAISLLPGADLTPVIHVRSDCSDLGTEIACEDQPYPGRPVGIVLGRQLPGTLYLIVDGSWGTAGPFSMTVEATSPPAPANDTCPGATRFVLPTGSTPLRLSGNTITANNDLTGACATLASPFDGPDVVYVFEVALAPTQITAKVTPRASSSSYLAAVYLRSSCAGLADDQCAANQGWGPSAQTVVASLNLGTYYLVVDGVRGTYGEFDLDITVDNARYVAGEQCTSATSLDSRFQPGLNGTQMATFSGDSTLAKDDGMGRCMARSGGGDYVYSFSVSQTSFADITVGPDNTAGTSTFATQFYLRQVCADPASELSCVSVGYPSMPAKTDRVVLARGTYFLFVDTLDNAEENSGPFAGNVTLSPLPAAPSNDQCAGAQSFTLPASGAPAMHLSASTLLASDDYSGACNGYPTAGKDVVYTFTVATDTWVSARIKPQTTAASYRPAAYIRATCGTPDNDVCKYATAAGGIATVTASLNPGTYYLIVDGITGSSGDFDLDVTVNDTKYRAGDHCRNAISTALLFQPNGSGGQTATLTGDTLLASNDGESSCSWASAMLGIAQSGNEYFYSFTVAQTSAVDIAVQPTVPTSKYTPHFYVRTRCTDKTSELICMNTGSTAGAVAARRLNHLAPGTYYLVIDSFGTSTAYNGAFSATVTISAAPAVPANDLCRTASALPFTGTGASPETVTVTGQDTSLAFDDDAGSCDLSNGPDLVYTFNTSVTTSFSATVTPNASPGYRPMLYLRSSCVAPAPEVTCARASTAGGAATLSVNSLPAGTWLLFVDGSRAMAWDIPEGRFDLSASLGTPVAGPTNDNCLGAQAITPAGVGSTVSLTGQTTVGAVHDGLGSCGTAGQGPPLAPDVVYSFELTAPAKVVAKVTPGSGYFPMLSLRSQCGGFGRVDEVACASSTTATAVQVTARTLHPGTYYLWVDSDSLYPISWAGTFSLELTLWAPEGMPPSNDTCAGAIPLTFGTQVTGETTWATNDYPWGSSAAPGCQPQVSDTDGAGVEVVYSYTPAQAGPFRISVNSIAGPALIYEPYMWGAAVWVGDGACGNPSTCIGGSDIYYSSEFILVPNGVAGRTYYIYVDGQNQGATGPFAIVATTP